MPGRSAEQTESRSTAISVEARTQDKHDPAGVRQRRCCSPLHPFLSGRSLPYWVAGVLAAMLVVRMCGLKD